MCVCVYVDVYMYTYLILLHEGSRYIDICIYMPIYRYISQLMGYVGYTYLIFDVLVDVCKVQEQYQSIYMPISSVLDTNSRNIDTCILGVEDI